MEQELISDEVEVTSMPTFIVEDDMKLAVHYYRKLQDVIEEPHFFLESQSAIAGLKLCTLPAIFWVDIHLAKKNYEGLAVLEAIKNYCPGALVIVYTAYDQVRQQCNNLKLPNFHFFEKSASSSTEDFEAIRALISEYTQGHFTNRSERKIAEYYAQVAHIDDEQGWVKLECYVDDSIEEALIEKHLLGTQLSQEVLIDSCLRIVVLQTLKGTKVVFTQIEGLPKDTQPDIKKLEIPDNDFFGSFFNMQNP